MRNAPQAKAALVTSDFSNNNNDVVVLCHGDPTKNFVCHLWPHARFVRDDGVLDFCFSGNVSSVALE